MRSALKILVLGSALAGVARVPGVIPQGNLDQYHAIPERNVFGLRPPPAQPAPTNAPPPVRKITLTGITTILETKRALMKVAPVGPKAGEAGKEMSLILTEGQREDDIEVLRIDENAGSVKVNNSGTVMVLTFEKDGAKLPSSGPAPGLPGSVPLPTALPTSAAASTNPYTLPTPGVLNFRARTHRPSVPGVAGAAAGFAPAVGGVPMPTGLTPNSPAATTGGTQDLTPEEQAIIVELQRQANVSNSALLPPTALTPTAPQPVESAVPQQGIVPAPARPGTLLPQ